MSKRVFEVMSSPPVSVGIDASLEDAARAMYESNVGSVVVVDVDGRLAGIVTRRDVIYLVARGEARRNPGVSTFMSTSVITAWPDEELAVVLDRMKTGGVKHVVVVEDDKPIGVVSMWDILTAIWRECLKTREDI